MQILFHYLHLTQHGHLGIHSLFIIYFIFIQFVLLSIPSNTTVIVFQIIIIKHLIPSEYILIIKIYSPHCPQNCCYSVFKRGG